MGPSHITFASFSPSSVFTTLSAAMSDCKTAPGRENESSQRRRRVTDSTMPLATVMHHHVSLHVLLSASPAASCWARAPADWWAVRNSTSSRRAALPQTNATGSAALTANDLNYCCVTSMTLKRGESSLRHQRELIDILTMTAGCGETWRFFIASSIMEEMVSCKGEAWSKWVSFGTCFECILPKMIK